MQTMRNVYVLWNDEAGKYIGNYGDLVGFDKARLYNRKSDATQSRNLKKNHPNFRFAEPVSVPVGAQANDSNVVTFEGTVLNIASKLKDMYEHLGEDATVALSVQTDDYCAVLDSLVEGISDPTLRAFAASVAEAYKEEVRS